MILDHAREDWYEATFDHSDHEGVASSLALAAGGRVSSARARNGYGSARAVTRDDRVLATVYGRSARAGEVHVAVSGASCDVVVPIVREVWPAHRVSRVDTAIDFAADFDVLDQRAVDFARSGGLKHSIIRDSEGGATRRIGSPASEVFVRVYKKTEQLRALHPDQADEVPDGVVRAECVVRPGNRAAKEAAATLTATDLWGLAQWSALFAVTLLDLEPMRTPTHFRRRSDWTRFLHSLGHQYGPAIQREIADRGLASVMPEVLAALGLDRPENDVEGCAGVEQRR